MSACEDDLSYLGFKNPNKKVRIAYAEIDVPTSVFIADSVATFNDPATNSARRLMVGRYFDEQFGLIETEAYTQFRPFNPEFVFPDNAKPESLELTLTLDYYYYGKQEASTHTLRVHELYDSIITEANYYYNSSVPYNPVPLGQNIFVVRPSAFDESLAANSDADASNNRIDTINVVLDQAYMQSLFDFTRDNRDGFREFRKFRRAFKGFAITSDGTDQVVGINPVNDTQNNVRSRLTLYYSYTNASGDPKRGKVEFSIFTIASNNGVMGFSRVVANRTNTVLSSLTVPYENKQLPGGKIYLQSGHPVVPRLDFSRFIAYTDSIPNMAINSAELSIEGIEPSPYAPPSYLQLRWLNDSTSEFRTNNDGIFLLYQNLLVIDNDGKIILGERANRSVLTRKFDLALRERNGEKYYSGNLTEYFQLLYNIKTDELRYRNFGLVASTPEFTKSVNRLIADQNKIKIKLYYSTPVSQSNQ